MQNMNLRTVDLNLLVVFDAVMETRSVTRAAQRIALSQPAVSHALRRLREVLKDKLFVRTPDGMVPTPRAEQLAISVSRILRDVRDTFEPAAFVPGTSDHRFTAAINNYAAVVFAASICYAVGRLAPGVRLDLRPSGTGGIVERLDRGDIDLFIGAPIAPVERFACRMLAEDSYVLLMRHGHPAERRKITPALLAEIPHLAITSSGEDTSFIDNWLFAHGLSRRIALSVPYLAACKVLGHSDLIAGLSRRMAMQFASEDCLQIREFPCATPIVKSSMVWHKRLNDQPAHRWLRETIVAAVAAPDRSAARPPKTPLADGARLSARTLP
jgi:DNA-binding transcriptional LysR family regulator